MYIKLNNLHTLFIYSFYFDVWCTELSIFVSIGSHVKYQYLNIVSFLWCFTSASGIDKLVCNAELK